MFTEVNCRTAIWSVFDLADNDLKGEFLEIVRSAFERSEKLRIEGSGTKSFYGNPVVATPLDVSRHSGIVSYEPSELVITARAGTRLSEINARLAESRQMLGFEPPWFGGQATLGGTIACGLSGPRRPYAGSARDFVLGVSCISGKGEYLAFGGQVIKNVAGYDVSRLMVGALGALGVICEVSLKVLPQPEVETTRVLEFDKETARAQMVRICKLPLPLSGMSFWGGLLRIRLSGTENGVRAAEQTIGGETDETGVEYWHQLREHELNFFNRNQSLWRLSVPATAPVLGLGDDCLLDWGGALRWIYTDHAPQTVFQTAKKMGGHATMFRPDNGWPNGRFSALDEPSKGIHMRLKSAFDPKGILNPGILYAYV